MKEVIEKTFEDIFDVMLNDTSIRLKMYEVIIERLYNENMKLKIEVESIRDFALTKELSDFFALDADTKSKKYKRDSRGQFTSDKKQTAD